ncbi:MAG: hypothetical protein U0271_05110 [Polyangiaceae bacterium]
MSRRGRPRHEAFRRRAGLGPRALRPLIRLFAVTVYVLLALFSWQAALIELVDTHDDSAECRDGERRGGPCDCGANCHCCVSCAHSGFTALPSPTFEYLPLFLSDLLELPNRGIIDRLASAERAPPTKVPKTRS